MVEGSGKKLIEVLEGKTFSVPPVWLMRQAGRYLPEYRATRAIAGSFLDLCYTPKHAIEVTLQPIRRYGFDAAIMFSDILVVPDALGRNVHFEEGYGPRLDPIDVDGIEKLASAWKPNHLDAVYDLLRGVRAQLSAGTTLLGFCGAPWTVATYMIAGHGTPDQAPARLFAYQHPKAFDSLLACLAEVSAEYLIRQIDAGADAVQIFDSWAGVLGEQEFAAYAVKPVRRIVDIVRAARPKAKIISFAKGAGYQLKKYREGTDADCIGLDWSVPLSFAAELQKEGAVQGNLDPMRVVAGGQVMLDGIDRILDVLGAGPLIFNLGHGITPDANPHHVNQLVARVREGR